jgi:uncharacterized SAM-binding protein YcdF (DUF218 family)
MIKNIKKTLTYIAALIIVFVGYIGFSIYFYDGTKDNLHADAAIVLGAAAWGGKPSPVFRERINHAIHLYNNHVIPTIIFTGGKNEGDAHAESYVAKKYAIQKGVMRKDILIETRSQFTEQNIYYASQIAERHKLDTLLIISDPLHMKRAMLMADDDGLIAYPSPTPTTRYKSWQSKMKFLSRETFYYTLYLMFSLFH